MGESEREFLLSEADVRPMVRLLGEVAMLRGGHEKKKRRLVEGLCQLIHADHWVWTLACQYEVGKPPVYVCFLHGGFNEDQFSLYLMAVEHQASRSMTASLINEMRERKSHVTRTIEQIDPVGKFSNFEATPFWRQAGIGTLLISMSVPPAASASIASIMLLPFQSVIAVSRTSS